MGVIMINCPQTGRGISTGVQADQASYGRVPVFFSRTLCPIWDHVWFARDAWVQGEDDVGTREHVAELGLDGDV
jgi:hypothetical protein